MSTKRNVTFSLIAVVVVTVAGTEVYDSGYHAGQRSVKTIPKSSTLSDPDPHIVETLLRSELEDALEKLEECERRLSHVAKDTP